MSAVLKYINDKSIVIKFDIWKWNYFWFTLINKLWEKIWDFIIPNKPLHLYIDDEDKNLLELLKKLWND